jgi:hypothetical protein
MSFTVYVIVSHIEPGLCIGARASWGSLLCMRAATPSLVAEPDAAVTTCNGVITART